MRSKKRPQNAVPLPEAIDGERWEIHRSSTIRTAGVALREKIMIVPFDKTEQARLVRAHEMVHTKITPKNLDRQFGELPEQILQLCEDARVHGHMNRLGFDTMRMEKVIPDDEMAKMATEAHPAELAGLAAAFTNTGELDRLRNAIGDSDLNYDTKDERFQIVNFGEKASWVRMHVESLPSFETTVNLAREIVQYLGDPREEKPELPPVPVEELGRLIPEIPKVEVHGDHFGKMVIEEPPLPLRLPGTMRGKRRKVVDVRGRRLHRIGRLHQDGRVFSHRPPLRGAGSVLIDTSGSMSLTTEDVVALCVHFPAGVIATYSGHNGVGILRVVARRGRRVADENIDPPGEGNLIDGPALDWLAKQPEPRFWISDAGVSGGAEGLRYCLDVCLRNKIKRVDDAWDILGKEV